MLAMSARCKRIQTLTYAQGSVATGTPVHGTGAGSGAPARSYIGVKNQVNGFAVSIFRMGVYRTVGTFATAEQVRIPCCQLVSVTKRFIDAGRA
jgi:hypothetical protein